MRQLVKAARRSIRIWKKHKEQRATERVFQDTVLAVGPYWKLNQVMVDQLWACNRKGLRKKTARERLELDKAFGGDL